MTDIADIQVDGRSHPFFDEQAERLQRHKHCQYVADCRQARFRSRGRCSTDLLIKMSLVRRERPIRRSRNSRSNSIVILRIARRSEPGRTDLTSGTAAKKSFSAGMRITGARSPFSTKISYRIIVDYTAALAALKAGDIDLQPRLLPIQYNEQTSGPAFDQQFTKVKYSIPSAAWIFWNNDRPFFKDKRCPASNDDADRPPENHRHDSSGNGNDRACHL